MKKILTTMLTAGALLIGAQAFAQKGEPINKTGIKTISATSKYSPAAKKAANSDAVKEALPKTSIGFSEKTHSFGDIPQGEKVEYTFHFKNTGDSPLKISNVRASCGCTTPEWSKEEVPVGGAGSVKAVFNSAGKAGFQKKSITITYNGEPTTEIIYIEGTVILPLWK